MATYKMTGGLIDNTQRRLALQPGLTPEGKRVNAPKTTTTATGASGAGAGAPAGPATPTTFTNTAQANPDMQAALKEYQDRIAQQKAREGQTNPLLDEQVKNLRERMSADQTQRATDRAGSNIRDFAAGQKAAASGSASRMGRPQGFRDASIDEAAQRNSAKASADIQMGQQDRLDRLVLGGSQIMGAPGQEALAREAGVTGLVGGLMGQAGAGAQLGLQQQQLGLQQYQTQANLELERQRMAQAQAQQQQALMLELLRSGGYY